MAALLTSLAKTMKYMKILPSKIKDSSLIADSYECLEGKSFYIVHQSREKMVDNN